MAWDEYKSLQYLPWQIHLLFIEEAKYLLNDLKTNVHKVTLLPAQNPKFLNHKIHALEKENPKWYSNLYQSHAHFRRDRSLCALERIAIQEDKNYVHLSHKKNKECLFEQKAITKGKNKKSKKKPLVPCKYGYDSLYRDFIFERLTKGYTQDGIQIPQNEIAKAFFYEKKLNQNTNEQVPF